MLIKRASLLFHEMLHVEVSFSLIRILNRKCAILPLLIRSIVILEEATVITISSCDLTFASKVLYKNVLPVPPGPSTKKDLDLCSVACIIA